VDGRLTTQSSVPVKNENARPLVEKLLRILRRKEQSIKPIMGPF
jgi:hypothetical protein